MNCKGYCGKKLKACWDGHKCRNLPNCWFYHPEAINANKCSTCSDEPNNQININIIKPQNTSQNDIDRLKTGYKNQEEKIDRLEIGYKNLEIGYKNLEEKIDRLEIRYKNLKEDYDWLKIDHKNQEKEIDRLKIVNKKQRSHIDYLTESNDYLTESNDDLFEQLKKRDELLYGNTYLVRDDEVGYPNWFL